MEYKLFLDTNALLNLQQAAFKEPFVISQKTLEEIENIKKDMTLLKEGFELLQYDYIGGSGSRGCGKVKFYDLQADVVVGDLEESIIEECNRILMEV